jgi:conjugal transfer pilus assembly protein TraB
MNIASIKNFILAQLDKAKLYFKKLFVAEENNPKLVRIKHIRLGLLIAVLFISICFLVIETVAKKTTNSTKASETTNSKLAPNVSGISELAKGVSNEQTWTELKGKEVDELKNKQVEIDTKQQDFEERVLKDKVSKDEVAELMMQLRAEMEESYNSKLEQEISKMKTETQAKIPEHALETKVTTKKKKIRKIGEYIPANSYAQAKLISGVDAGVGMISEALILEKPCCE